MSGKSCQCTPTVPALRPSALPSRIQSSLRAPISGPVPASRGGNTLVIPLPGRRSPSQGSITQGNCRTVTIPQPVRQQTICTPPIGQPPVDPSIPRQDVVDPGRPGQPPRRWQPWIPIPQQPWPGTPPGGGGPIGPPTTQVWWTQPEYPTGLPQQPTPQPCNDQAGTHWWINPDILPPLI